MLTVSLRHNYYGIHLCHGRLISLCIQLWSIPKRFSGVLDYGALYKCVYLYLYLKWPAMCRVGRCTLLAVAVWCFRVRAGDVHQSHAGGQHGGRHIRPSALFALRRHVGLLSIGWRRSSARSYVLSSDCPALCPRLPTRHWPRSVAITSFAIVFFRNVCGQKTSKPAIIMHPKYQLS